MVSAADVESGEPGDDEKVIGCSSEGDRERIPAGVLGRPSGDRQQAAKQEEEGEAVRVRWASDRVSRARPRVAVAVVACVVACRAAKGRQQGGGHSRRGWAGSRRPLRRD